MNSLKPFWRLVIGAGLIIFVVIFNVVIYWLYMHALVLLDEWFNIK